jgi:hypothetical protein
MRPTIAQFLTKSAQTLGMDVAPNVRGDPYAAAKTGMIGTILILLAQESERAADTLIREQDAIRALFLEAAHAPLDDDLRARLEAAGGEGPRSHRLDVLEAESARLNAVLIELHEAVEAGAFDWAEALEARIWEILRLGAECRAVFLPTL